MNRQKANPAAIAGVTRDGLTVIELLIVIGLLSLLLALLVPAVQRSRAAARRVTCSNQLKQIALASHQYHDQFGHFPIASRHMEKLMPFMEQAVDLSSVETAFTPPAFLCPADPLIHARRLDCSYFCSSGSGQVKFKSEGFGYDGMICPLSSRVFVSLSDVTDGTSNTAMYSERLSIGDRNAVTDNSEALKNKKIHMWYMSRDYNLMTEFRTFQADCLQHSSIRAVPTLCPIFDGLITIIGYNHAAPPNHPGCYSIAPPRHGAVDVFNGSIPATSMHDGGVHAAFVDGHVAFVSELIDYNVWMNLGSRNGGEPDVGSW